MRLSRVARSLWAGVAPVPADPILGLVARYRADSNPNAVNLAQGAYRDDEGKPFVLPAVVDAERRVAEELAAGTIDKEYTGIEGYVPFLGATARFAFGEKSPILSEDRVATVQALSGTGALRLAADTLAKVAGVASIWLSSPSWGNHGKVFEAAGLKTQSYTYLDQATKTRLDFDGLCRDLESKVPKGSVVLLHACAHNPTGVDPSLPQWEEIAQIFAARSLVPLFDSAYQGYATGDPDVDAAAIRTFAALPAAVMPSMLVAQSYAKNMGLYGERVGALNVVTEGADQTAAVLSQLKQRVIRPMYSSPPLHGARLATSLLEDPALRASWQSDLARMADRIALMRTSLVSALDARGGGGREWGHITDQIGMFAYTGLTATQVDALLEDHGIYLTRDGRMSLAGLRSADVDTVADAIVAVVEQVQ